MTRALVVGLEDECLELIKAVVDTGPALLLHDWLVALSFQGLLAHFDIESHLGVLCV